MLISQIKELNKWIMLAVLSALLPFCAFAQEDNDDDALQDIIEYLAQHNESESFDYSDLLENLEQLKLHPLNLNRASEGDLNKLISLSPQQISSLLRYIQTNGVLISVYELQAVPDFDLNTIRHILPYITLNAEEGDASFSAKTIFSKGRFTLLARYRQVLEKSEGYRRKDGSGYLGKPFGLYTRFRYQYMDKLSYGFTMEKDPGEEFFKGANKQGFDFYSGHFFLSNFKSLKALALGDYEVHLGQGLILWTGYGSSKGPEVMNVKKVGDRLSPYTSSNEYNFMRGAAFTAGKKGFELTSFISFKQVDANLINPLSLDTLEDSEAAFSSFNESGYHRTNNEIADRNAVNQLLTGGNLSYNRPHWHVGINGLYARFFNDYKRNLKPYNQFDLNRNQLINASIDYHWLIRNVHFFGEEAISDNSGFGLLNGVLMSVDPKVDLSLVHRYYSRNYQTLYANAFAESSQPQNENGIYLGLVVRPLSFIRFDLYTDLYKHQWLSYRSDAPSWGSDNYAQVSFTPNKKFSMYLRYRFEWSKKNRTEDDGPMNYLADEKHQSLRYQINYQVSEAVTLANRIEWSYYRIGNSKPENGFLIYQDVKFNMLRFPLSFNARIAIFKTDSYNSRIYAYENDVLYSFSIPAYYSNGLRWYLTLHYAVTRHIDIWVRAAQTSYFDINKVGSGLDEIDTNHKTEIKAQVRLSF